MIPNLRPTLSLVRPPGRRAGLPLHMEKGKGDASGIVRTRPISSELPRIGDGCPKSRPAEP